MSSATRMRVPHKIHILSWAIALERSGSVPCHFKDCQFMALSLDEMGNHYPFCACENNKYPFVCETCSRRTDTMEKLLLHKSYSHSYQPTDEESRMINSYLAIPIKKEITSILRRSWEIFLDRKKYLKCLLRKCLFVTHTISDMEDHYLNFCKEAFWSKLKYDCVYCNGRLPNDYDLKLHIKKAHGSKAYLMKTNVEPDESQKNIQMWSEEIMLYKQGKCFVEGCQFVDNYVKILEKHYATCDGTRKNFIVCCACGSWLLNEARLDEHKRCFHKNLDEEDFKRLSHQSALESENHSSLLLDDMSPDENDSISGEGEVDNERRAIDLKKYNGVINRASQKSSSLRLSSPVFPAKNTDSIDCAQVSDKSGIQFDSDIIEINEGSLDIIDIDSSVTKKVLNDGMKLNDKIKRRKSNAQYITDKNRIKDEKKTFSVFHKRNHENWSTTPLQAFANEMMKENKNISTVPVQIKVDNKDWTVNVSTTVVSQTKSSTEFPRNRETLFKSLKEESYRLLKLVSKKNSIRNDVRMVFDPNENRITPFHINFMKGDSSSDKGPDNLDMTKFLSSDIEDSDDDISNSDMSECDGHDLISCPVSLPSMESSGVKVPNEVQNNINKGPNHFCGGENKMDSTLSTTLNHCNNSKETGSKNISNNEKLSNSYGPGPKSEISPQNRIKTEINHDDNISKDFRGKEVSPNPLSEGSDILCLSNINHLGEEVVVKKESDQKVLPKKIFIEEAGSVVQIEVLSMEGSRQDAVTKSEEGVESEYIIPEIDFIDNAGFRCPNENTNESDPFHADISHSSYDFESDTGVDLTEDDLPDMQRNGTSQDAREKYITHKSNKDLVLLDGELPTSSLLATNSGVKSEKDPLSVDGFTDVVLFCDSENNDDNGELDSSDKNESTLSENNIHLPDNNENGISDNIQESNEESTNDFNLSKKWNWSNLKKYNSKTTQNDLTKMDSRHCNKPSKEDENFLGFIDCSDSSSKYSDFVSACTKLGYYDDMVILNQHYEIIPPNKKDLKLLHSESTSHGLLKEPLTPADRDHNNEILVKKISEVNTHRLQEGPLEKSQVIDNHKPDNDQEEDAFLGFKSNDDYTEFRRKSIEISRRLSAEFSDGTNKIDQHLSNTNENISGSLVVTNEKNTATESSVRNSEVSSNELKLIDQALEQDASLVNNKKSDLTKLNVDSNGVGIRENTRIASIEPASKKRGRPRKNHCTKNTDSLHEELKLSENDESVNQQLAEDPNLVVMIVGTENKTECYSVSPKSPSSNVIDLVQGTNDSQVNTDVIVKAVGCQSTDSISLIPTENSFSCGLDTDLNEVKNKENDLDNSIESVQKKRGNPKKNSSQLKGKLITSSSTEQVNVVSLITDNPDTEVKQLGALGNDDRSVMNDPPKGSEQESTPILEINVDHGTENFRDREQMNNVSDHSVDNVSLIPLENKENILSKPVESVSKNKGRPKKNQSQLVTSEVAIKRNDILDLKEEATRDDESDQLPTNDESVNQPDISVLSLPANNASRAPKSHTSKLTSFSQSMNCTEEDNNASHDEIKELSHDSDKLNSSVRDKSSFKINGNSITSSCVSVQKKRGRPRKNSVNLITSTPNNTSNSSDCQNGENANTESYSFDNEKSILNSTADELSANDFISKNERIMTEPSNNAKISSVFKQEDIEDRPQKKLKMESTVIDGFPVKRKPGRPPKRSSCSQNPEQLQRKSDNIDSSLATSDSENKSLVFNSSASLQCEQLASSEIKDAVEKAKNILLTKKEDILKMPLKRKPGRPPKRFSICVKESEVLKTNSNNSVLDTSITINESENESLLLNSTAISESESLDQKDVEEKSKDILQIEKEDISETQLKKNSVLDTSITISESKNESHLLNSTAISESESLDQKEEEKSKDILQIEKEDISETQLKRKPGRPPKRLSICVKESEVLKTNSNNSVLDTSITINESENESLLLNSTAISESEYLEQKEEEKSKDILQIEKEDISETQLKSNSVLGTSIMISESKNESHLLNSTAILESESLDQKDVEEKSKDILQIEKEDISETQLKRKPGRPPKRLSICVKESEVLKTNSNNSVLDTSITINESENESLLLNSTAISESEDLEQKEEEKSKDILQIEKEDISETQLKSNCVLGTSIMISESKNESHLLNSTAILESESLDQKGVEEKSKDILQIEKENISETQLKKNSVLDTSITISESKKESHILNSTVISESESLDQKDVEEKSKDILQIEKEDISETQLKRKPGRPPKRLSIKRKEISQCHKEMISVLIQNSESSMNDCLITNSFSNEDKSCANSQLQVRELKSESVLEKKYESECKTSSAPIIKRKPGRPPKHSLLHYGEVKKCHVTESLIEQKDSIEPPLKRKPGRPPKCLSMSQQKTLQSSIENTNMDVSTGNIDLNPLSNKEFLSLENANQTVGNKEENNLELIEKIPDVTLNRICMTQPNLEECQFENNSVSAKESEYSADKSISNSFSCGENLSNVSLSKNIKNELEVEVKDIVEPPLKRKPGRPPKRLSMGQQGIGICSSGSTAMEKNDVEPPLKRKPGRPPKRLSIGQQGIDKCQIGGIKDTLVSNSKSLDNSLLSSFSNENDLSRVSHSEEDIKNKMVVEKKVSFEAPLKRKPGRPPKYLSVSKQGINKFQNTNNGNQNVILNSSVTDHSEPAPKRKPGRPRKVSLELKNTVENDKDNSVQDIEHFSIKMENESSFITDDNSLDALQLQDENVGCIEYSQSMPKRKPGRPRKVSIFLGESSDATYKIIFENGDFSVQSSSPFESSVNSEHTPKRRPGRPRKINSEQEVMRMPERERRVATSTPFANERASSFSSFADLELLDESNLDEYEGSIKRAGRAKRGFKGFRGRWRDRTYSETYYTTFNDDDTNLETFGTAQTQNRIPNIDASSNVTLNSEDGCDNDVTETDLSQEKESLDESELTSKQKARIEKRKLLSGRVDSVTKLKNPNDKVKCALCDEMMTVIHYQQVHLPKHNFLAWLEGEEPLPLDDFDAMDTLLVRGKRAHPKFIFKCEVCNLEKKSSKGFLSHRQFCGKSDKERENMMVLCVYCGRPMMPASLQPHLYQCHRTEPALTLPEEPELTSGSVRKAAAKCLGKIASLIEEDGLTKNGEDYHLDGDEEFDEIEEISLLYIPVQKRKPSKHMMNRWKQLAADNEELRCMVPTCRFRTWLIRDIVEHHKSCSADGSQGYSCIKCNYICKVEDEMREHVKTCNPPIMVSQSDNSEDEDHEKHVMIPYLRSAEQNLNVRYKVLFFKPALAWMKEIYEKYFTQEPLYPDLPLNLDLWEEMDPHTSQFYNPEKSNSMMVSFQNSSWESMHALEGKVIEGDQGIAYTGGPVWGLEWCPGEGPQYLAVSSHLSMEFNFQAGSTFTGPGLVQLWSLEDISNDKSDSLSTLQFCYGVCHNDRACWNIAWCPSGGRTETRIGLLALATTSGSIPIYAMPNPECLQYQSTRLYKPDPVLKLELWSNERWQCSAISWSKIKPHNIIAAGFVNGMVAVWNLETKSNLLRKKIILYPFKVFQAHHSIITGVCLSPESDSYLATASYDKSFKYWDLVDTTAPHTVLKRGLFTSVDWLRHWMSAVTTYDNAYTMMQTTVSLSSLRGFVNPTTPIITSINSTAWSVSVNDWLNGAITSYDNGQVVLFLALRQSIYHHLDKRKFSKVILNSTLHNIEAKDGPIEPNSKQKEKEIHINNMPSNSYGDAVHKYGLSIRTDPDIGKNDKFQEKSPENMNDIYPLSSINRVAWNTNRKSFLYTAMGYQSGFFVVSKLSFHSKDLNAADELSKF